MTAKPTTLLTAMQIVTRQLSAFDIQVHSINTNASLAGHVTVTLQVADWDTFETVAKTFGLNPAQSRYIGADNDAIEGPWSGMTITVYGAADPAKKTACHCHDQVPA
jgi:hypothetical protein